MKPLIIRRQIVPRRRLIPAQGFGIRYIRVDPHARLGKLRLFLELYMARQVQSRSHLLSHPESEGSLTFHVAAGIDLGKPWRVRQVPGKPLVRLGQ